MRRILQLIRMRTFKFGPAQADERFVNDSADPASPRVAHDPVNDSGGTPAATDRCRSARGVAGRRIPDPAGFRFNLDDALARLSEPHQPIPRFNWSSVTPSTTDLVDDGPDRDGQAPRRPATTDPASLAGTDAHGRHGADGRRLRRPPRRARRRRARCSPIRTREPARSPNRPSIRCPRSVRRPRSAPPPRRTGRRSPCVPPPPPAALVLPAPPAPCPPPLR